MVGAALAQRPGYGGHAWALLQYALGFQTLGFDVTVVDRLEADMVADGGVEAAVRYVAAVMEGAGLAGSYCVLGEGGASLAGLSREEALRRARAARLFLNVMGFIRDPELLEGAHCRVFLDIDPGFGQMWRELGLADVFAGHDAFVTVGRNIGEVGCDVPTCGLRWLTIPHPVVLERCPRVDGGADFTSIGSWRGPYDRIEFHGRTFGLRAHQLRQFAALPRLAGERFRLALDIDSADARDIDLLREGGWTLVDPLEVASDPSAYLRFVQGSLAELTVAKDIYVQTRSGWLGDRTVCYLASGKPALVQDTGLAPHYPLGEGLLAFSTLEEALAGVAEIRTNHAEHARAARRLAEQEFDARLVLGRLLDELG